MRTSWGQRWAHRWVWAWSVAAASLAAAGLAAPVAATTVPAAGSLDTSFGSGGSKTVAFGTLAAAAAVAIQSNGKIVTAGEAEVGGQDMMLATRMNANGTLDGLFGRSGIVTVPINGSASVDSGAGLALQSDGKIVMAGSGRNSSTGQLSFAAVRLKANGTLDSSFGQGGIATVSIGTFSIANAIVVQPNGKLVLGGTALVGHNEFAAARLNANGTLDSSFGYGGLSTLDPTGGAWGIALQGDGKIVLAGQADYANPHLSGAQQFMAARLLPSGTLDTSFGTSGIAMVPVGATALGYGIALQRDGKLVLAGPAWTSTCVNALVRLNSDGSTDPSYGRAGTSTIPDCNGANGIALDASGRAVLPAVGASALRFTTSGAPDSGFGSGGMAMAQIGSGGAANGAAIQSGNGKIVLAGATTLNGRTVLLVIRMNP